ncbi:hypothetical protein WJX82_011171 [Trebouxia sp. C0006]
MTSTRHPVITDLPPTASIKHITLDDGQQASVVIQGGRITKILAANGQVAELRWKDDAANNNNNWRVKYHKSPPSEQAGWQDKGSEGAFQSSAGSDSDKIMETPVQDTPPAQPRMYTTPTSQPPFMSDAMQYSSMGGTSMPMSMRPNSPEMPTILETNSQASPDNHMPHTGHHQAPQSSWNPTHSWIPATSMGQSPAPPVGSLTGHYPADKVGSTGKQAQLHSAPSPANRNRSQSLPYQPGTKGSSASRVSADGQQRRSYGQNMTDDGRYEPETPDPQEQRGVSRASAPDSSSSQVNADTASSTPPAKKKLTVWKKLKKALFPPTKSSKREATAQQLMQGGAGAGGDATTPQRYSEKHADPSDGVVSYSRKTSFQEARENQKPAYRHSMDSRSSRRSSYRQALDLSQAGQNPRQSLDSSGGSQHPSYRHSGDSTQLAQQQGYGTQSMELPARHTHHQQQQQQQQASYRQPMDQASQDPYLTPPQYREAGPAGIEGNHEGQMLSYPPLENVERRRSGSNVDFGTRRALAANLQMVEPYSNGIHRPTYTQSYAAPDRSNRRSSLSTDFSFGVSEDSSLPNLGLPPMAPSQERLKQQQYMRQQFIQQQQEERRRSGSLPLSEQQWDPRGAADGSPVRQNSASSMMPDKSQQLHSAPIRASSLDAPGDAKRSRRLRTVDYSKPGGEAPFSVPAMSGMAGRWVKNMNQGTEGSEVDDLLQLSYLQRLARQKVAEMEIIETMEIFEIVWNIPLNNGHSKIKKSDQYLKNSEVCELPRRDGRQGVLRSQINFTPEGHVHIRALQGDPFGAVFHDRIKMSTGGHRLKIEQKFQLLAPGVMPVKHHSIWQRIEETN